MRKKPAGGRSVKEVLDLLKDQEFCADAQGTIEAAAAITVQPSTVEERQQQLEQLGQPFEDRWRVVPPTTGELLDSDPRRRFSDAIAAGRWGLVLVFEQTTNKQVDATVKNIRSAIRKRHQDALIVRHAQLVRWLDTIGFDRPAIARVVFGRRKGLRRPTTAAVIRRNARRERQLFDEYRGLGLTYRQIEQKIYKTLRGSEAPARAAVRMVQQRYVGRLEDLNEDLASPVQSEPLSHALTMLFRALPDDVRQHADAVWNAFVRASVPDQTAAERRDEASQHHPLEAIVSALWGVVPIFPWTTDPDFRASVTKLRAMMRAQRQNSNGQVPTARPIPFEPLSDALVLLFQALSQGDDVVRRRAFEARATFLRAGAS